MGIAAEAATERWLTSQGWTVIARRWRRRGGGELDLLAVDPAGVLVALEVRARRTRRTGGALMSVDARRVSRLRTALASAAATLAPRHRGLRVDLVAAEPAGPGTAAWRLTRVPGIG